ncbi:MAG: phosphotransferase, partial [Planctomycetota bacterium]
ERAETVEAGSPPQAGSPQAGSPQAGSHSTSPGSPACRDAEYQSFAVGEIAIVCSRYELGTIDRVKPFRRGSRRSPKAVLETARGRLLLKRRAAEHDSMRRLVFAHAIQSKLLASGLPLARLVRTRDGQSSVMHEGRVYELFDFVEGRRYDRSVRDTADAGITLARLHTALADSAPSALPGHGSYHDAPVVADGLRTIASRSAGSPEAACCSRLASVYAGASARVRSLGIATWPRQVVHADFHPGNLVFQTPQDDGQPAGARVRAILDFDACRMGARAIDVANAALQFSVLRSDREPASWPDGLDLDRLRAFITAYDRVPGCLLSKAEMAALPWLMTEALIAEATIPIRTSGRFGPYPGEAFLAMVERKTAWVAEHAGAIESL